jgi:hypothetical protein
MIENALRFYALATGKFARECLFERDGECKKCACTLREDVQNDAQFTIRHHYPGAGEPDPR